MNNSNSSAKLKVYLKTNTKKNTASDAIRVFAVVSYDLKPSIRQELNSTTEKCCVFKQDLIVK